jgi:hypothetical protein
VLEGIKWSANNTNLGEMQIRMYEILFLFLNVMAGISRLYEQERACQQGETAHSGVAAHVCGTRPTIPAYPGGVAGHGPKLTGGLRL